MWTQLSATPLWLAAGEAGSARVGRSRAAGWCRALLRATTLIRESATLLEESDYTTRFRLTGQEEIDRLIDIYNRMVDALRTERVRVREQHHFLQRVLDVSPSGAVILDHDGRVDASNPAAARLLGASVVAGVHAATADTPLSDVMTALESEPSAVVTLPGARRAKASRATFMDRGFPRRFVLIEELTDELRQAEKAAYEKLIRMLSHEVNNSMAASNSLLTSVRRRTRDELPAERGDMARPRRRCAARTAQLGAFMKAFADVGAPARAALARATSPTCCRQLIAMADGGRGRPASIHVVRRSSRCPRCHSTAC